MATFNNFYGHSRLFSMENEECQMPYFLTLIFHQIFGINQNSLVVKFIDFQRSFIKLNGRRAVKNFVGMVLAVFVPHPVEIPYQDI